MFLSKKNAHYFNKPKAGEAPKKRVLGGWDDNDSDPDQKIDYTNYHKKPESLTKVPAPNLLENQGFEATLEMTIDKQETTNAKNTKFYFDWDELNERNDIECEKKLVEDLVQPIGIRIKPSENSLAEFLKEAKGMDIHIIGSLLLSKIEVNYAFQIKAKALYGIEYLVKKHENFAAFFKAHYDKLESFPEPEDNAENYRKILKSVLAFLGVNSSKGSQQQQKKVWVDPGYNEQPEKVGMAAFLQENSAKGKTKESKKKIIGPGQVKKAEKKDENNILDLDLLGGTATESSQQKEVDLLAETEPKNTANNITFEDLLGNPTSSQPFQF